MVAYASYDQFEPRASHKVIVDTFVADADAILAMPAGGDVWTMALQNAPDRHVTLDEPAVDDLLVALGDFVDLKCPFTIGHSRATARWPPALPSPWGSNRTRVALTRRAAHLHDIGRIGVSNQICPPGELTMSEFERMRLHPYLTERILQRVPGLAGGRGRHQPPRMPERLGLSAWCLRSSADDARPAAGLRSELSGRIGAAALP